MFVRSAQLTLVGISVASLAIVLLVFVTGRLWGFPLDYVLQEEIPLVQLLAPPLFGVLGSAANYVTAPGNVKVDRKNQHLMKVLIWLPSLAFLSTFLVVTAVFYISNQPDSGTTFSLDAYRFWLTTILAFFSLTIPVISAALFRRAG